MDCFLKQCDEQWTMDDVTTIDYMNIIAYSYFRHGRSYVQYGRARENNDALLHAYIGGPTLYFVRFIHLSVFNLFGEFLMWCDVIWCDMGENENCNKWGCECMNESLINQSINKLKNPWWCGVMPLTCIELLTKTNQHKSLVCRL